MSFYSFLIDGIFSNVPVQMLTWFLNFDSYRNIQNILSVRKVEKDWIWEVVHPHRTSFTRRWSLIQWAWVLIESIKRLQRGELANLKFSRKWKLSFSPFISPLVPKQVFLVCRTKFCNLVSTLAYHDNSRNVNFIKVNVQSKERIRNTLIHIVSNSVYYVQYQPCQILQLSNKNANLSMKLIA